MIGEARSGASFRGLVQYLLHGSEERGRKVPAWVELRNLAGEDPERVHAEMRATASQSPRVRQPVYHLVLSPASEDRLERRDWLALADRVLEELGLGEHQAVVALHTDTDHPHLHLAVNRVHPGTLRAWDRWQDRPRIEKVLRRIEREWGLRRVPGRLAGVERGEAGRGREGGLSQGQRAGMRYRAAEPQVVAWRRELGPAFAEARSWSDLAVRLQVNGVHLEARGRGLVVTDGEVYVKASSIGREYSRGRLEGRFGEGFAAWRAVRERFGAAAETYVRYAHRGAGDRRGEVALRALRSAGKALGWRAAGRLAGPLAPAVGAVLMAGARAEGRGGSREAWEGLVAERVAPALRRVRSWAEAEGRLRFHGVGIGSEGERGRVLLVTDGVHSTRLEDLGADLGREGLEGRLGSWAEWRERRRELLGRARRLDRFEATVEQRKEVSRRLGLLIRESERRVAEYGSRRDELRRVEGRLLRLMDPWFEPVGRRNELHGLVQELGNLSDREVARQLRVGWRGVLSDWRRRGELPEELKPVLREYRELYRDVRRRFPVARSAARRLPELRQRAFMASPHRARGQIRQGLERVARKAGEIGVRSLLARAAPGLSPALTLVRVVRRLGRELERDGGRGR